MCNRSILITRMCTFMLLITMLFTLAVGCGGNAKPTGETKENTPEKTASNKPASWISDTPIKFTMLYKDNPGFPYNKEWLVLQEIKKKTNVELECQVTTGGNDYNQKKQIVLSSGEIPDIVSDCWANEMGDYATNGVLLPISDYLNKMPNLSKIIKDWKLEEDLEDIKEIDGKYYILPSFKKELKESQGFGLRVDLFKKNNIKIPDTYEDVYQALKKLKEIYPDSLGLSDQSKGDQMMAIITRSFGTNSGYSINGGANYEWDQKKWVFEPTTPEFREVLRYFNKLYKEGLLDPEAFTQDRNQFNQKLYNGKILASCMWRDQTNSWNAEMKKLGLQDADFRQILPPAGPKGIRGVKSSNRINGGSIIPASAAKKPYFDKLLKFVDWLYYSEEALLLNEWGTEGVTYAAVNGQKQLKSDIKCNKTPDAPKSRQKDFGMDNLNFKIMNNMDFDKWNYSPEDKEYYKTLLEKNWIPKEDPQLKFKADEAEQAKLLSSTLKDFIKEMQVKFIFGKASLDSDWDNYVKECEKKGSTKLVELKQKAYDRQTKK